MGEAEAADAPPHHGVGLERIGAAFGGRNYDTARHACLAAHQLRRTSPPFLNLFRTIRHACQS